MRRTLHPALIPLGLAGALAANPPAAGLNQFATSTYHQLAPGGGNLIFSPFSISIAMSMLLAGARGQTATQVAAVLHQAYPSAGYNASLASLVDQLTHESNTDGNQLSIANALWLQSGFPVEAAFKNTLTGTYKAAPEQLDFRTAAEQARARINNWTEQHTDGKIRDLFGPGTIAPSTRLVLTSAIYFDGKWKLPFQTSQTRPEPFHTSATSTVEANFMHRTAEFGYVETSNAQVLEMKYAGIPVVFDAILPKAGTDLSVIEKSLSPELLSQSFGKIEDVKVNVAIPKFRAESSFSLRDTLSKMGMPDAFDSAADFSGIDGKHDLQVSDIVHKAFVDVSEEGTVAAAATGTGIAMAALRQGPTPVFRADRPFLFFIRDTKSGVILFAGRVVNPK
jgi:serpin B